MKRISFCDDWFFCQSGQTPRAVSIPHDAMQEQGRSSGSSSGGGGAFFLGGNYVYEKKLVPPEEWKNQEVILECEGIYPEAEVFLNGEHIGGSVYGYNLFRVSLDGLVFGRENTIRIEVDGTKLPNSRWYSGTGIYRPVWILTGRKENHINPDGIRVTTLSVNPAKVQVNVEYSGSGEEEVDVEILFAGQKVTGGAGTELCFEIPDAHLWDVDTPDLYECKATLKSQGTFVDEQSTSFGVRLIEWSPRGFFVNGKSTLLKGGCIHHDNGVVGARSYTESEWRRIKKLKDLGFNAIRSAHNPLCKATLEACDTLGMYVLDEIWDMWNKPKTACDYANHFMDNFKSDIVNIVTKDYNHPSVVMYSIGNEVTEPVAEGGIDLTKQIVTELKKYDTTRPVTAGINLTMLCLAVKTNDPGGGFGEAKAPSVEGMNSTKFNQMVSELGKSMTTYAATEEADKVSSPIFELLDIAGYNYADSRYEKEGEIHPERIVLGTETYAFDLRKNWKQVEKYPYLIGDFMWTAWDYIGEVGLGGWSYDMNSIGFSKSYPWLLADTGAVDILGNENAEAGLASVVWGTRKTPYIGVCPVNHPGVEPVKAMWRGTNAIPYWSYQGCDGNEAKVEVYTDAKEVELFVNDRSAGRKMVENYLARFTIPYERGELKAVAYNEDGSVQSESRLTSADQNVEIVVTQEDAVSDARDVIYLDISLRGGNGEVECNRDTTLRVSVDGGTLLGFGSANPWTEENFLAGEYATYYGRSQAIVKPSSDTVVIYVSGEGFSTVEKTIKVQKYI